MYSVKVGANVFNVSSTIKTSANTGPNGEPMATKSKMYIFCTKH